MLTTEQQALRDAIAQARRTQEEAQHLYREVKARCKAHIFENNGDEAICTICGENGGWWCPVSPNHTCEYTQGEFCVHCGNPEERK